MPPKSQRAARFELTITSIGSIITAAIAWPFTAVSTALVYVDRRMRREGLDIELARAAGYAPPGQSATPGTPLATHFVADDMTIVSGTIVGVSALLLLALGKGVLTKPAGRAK